MSESGTTVAASPSLRFDIFTLFPGIFAGPLDESIVRRARDRGIVQIDIHDIRDWAMTAIAPSTTRPMAAGPGW